MTTLAPKQFFVTSTAGTRGKTIAAKDKRAARTIYSNLTGFGFKNCKAREVFAKATGTLQP